MAQIDFQLDKSAGAPALYLQVADQVTQAVKEGRYRPGDRLFTENELMELTGLSRGTVKAAYGTLQERGVVRKVRGSGVYVRDHLNRRQPPRHVMEALFDSLAGAYGLKASEADRLIQEVTAQIFEDDHPLHVTVTDCSVEILPIIKKQLEKMPGIVVKAVTLEEILLNGDEILNDRCDLVLTTQLHYPSIRCYTEPMDIPTEPFTLCGTKETLEALSKLPQKQKACAIYRREPFVESIRYLLHTARLQFQLIPFQEQDEEQLERYSHSGIPFFLPCDYLTHSSNRTLQYVYRARAAGSVIVPIEFEIAQESLRHIGELVNKMRGERREQGR